MARIEIPAPDVKTLMRIYGDNVLDMLDLDLWDLMDLSETKAEMDQVDLMIACQSVYEDVFHKPFTYGAWEFTVEAIESFIDTLSDGPDEDE